MKSQRMTPRISAGYSLIEVLVVLAIIGILAYAGATQFMSKRPVPVRGVTVEVAGVIRSIQTLARSSGRQVFMQTSGGGGAATRVDWGFQDTPGEIQGSWTMTNQTAAYASIGVGRADLDLVAPNPAPDAVPAINGLVSATAWDAVIFDGNATPTTPVLCNPNGAFSTDFIITISGRTGEQVGSGDNSIGLIVVGTTSGMGLFYKPNAADAATPWQRL